MPPKTKKEEPSKSVDKKGAKDDKKPADAGKKGNEKGEDAEKSTLP